MPEYPQMQAFASMFFLSLNIIMWSFASWVMTGDRRYMSVKKALVNPAGYAVAVGLIYGKAGFQEFEEDLVSDPTVCNLTEKVHVTANDELSAVFPKKQAAIVTVQARGERFTKRVDFPKGEPENPLTGEEFKARYDGLMAYGGVDSAASDRIYSEITTAGDDHRLHIGI